MLRQQDYVSLARNEMIKGSDFLLRVNNDDWMLLNIYSINSKIML
jgi:hypothetical protein